MAQSYTQRELTARIRQCRSILEVRHIVDPLRSADPTQSPYADSLQEIVAAAAPVFDDELLDWACGHADEPWALEALIKNPALTREQRELVYLRAASDFIAGPYIGAHLVFRDEAKAGRITVNSPAIQLVIEHARAISGPSAARLWDGVCDWLLECPELTDEMRGEFAARCVRVSDRGIWHGASRALVGWVNDGEGRSVRPISQLPISIFRARLMAAKAISVEAAGVLFLLDASPEQLATLSVDDITPYLSSRYARIRHLAVLHVGTHSRSGDTSPAAPAPDELPPEEGR